MPSAGNSRLPLPSPPALIKRIAAYADLLRRYTEDVVPNVPGLDGFYGMLAYHLGWVDSQFQPQDARAGKSLRPALCLLLGESLGAAPEVLTPFAAGIELLHNFSLIHDDIQDQSATRRGRPTVWTLWGAAQAINAGDAMFALAHAAWLRSTLGDNDPRAFIDIVRSLEQTVLRLCEGQFLDMSGEGSVQITAASYLAMIERKTAALIGEAAWIGARVATDDAALLAAARGLGTELGLAFQIRDDLLGIWGDERETGKSASSDIASRKMTLPVIVALEQGPPTLRDELRSVYRGSTDIDETRVRGLLDQAGAQAIAAEREEYHWQAAMRALEKLPLAPEWHALVRDFAWSFVGRSA